MKDTTAKQALLEAGRRFIITKGYNHTGLQEVLQAAGVPKGSFYHYFTSKEDFGMHVLNRYVETHDALLGRLLADETLTPLMRLRRYFEVSCAHIVALQHSEGCMVGNLSQELADQNQAFRVRLAQILESWSDRLAECLTQAQQAGEIPADLDPRLTAEFCLNSWEGAILRAKVMKSAAPLDTFLHLIFDSLLRH